MGASFLNLVATKVTVKGEEQKFVSLHLRQGFNRHHTFTVMVNYLSPNNTFQQTPEKFIGYIGETASISFVHRQTGESYDFEGIITQVEMVGSMGETGGVAIHGTSPTILYENNRTLDSWMDQSLSTIIKEVTQEYGKVNLVSNPKYATPIPYMAQYNESVFDFMNRLSALYGEWFYYDGTKVYFGKPDRDNTEKIVYDMDLEEVRLVANLVPGKSARYDYVAQENKQHNADTPAKPDGMNDLQSIAHSCSEKAYTAKTTSAADPHVTDKAELDEQMRIVKNASGANLLNIKGIGKTCRIRIGEIIDVSFPDRMKLPPLGKFRIVGIEHEVRRDGHYSNSFVGVPDGTVHIPVPSEGIAEIPQNRTLLVEQLTKDEPVAPEVVAGLTNIDEVFAHFRPEIDIEFADADGAPVEENFRFHNVGDFSVRKMTEQSSFLSGLNAEKQFADRMEKSLRSNKVLQRVLENPETRGAFVNAISAILDDLKNNEKSNPTNE